MQSLDQKISRLKKKLDKLSTKISVNAFGAQQHGFIFLPPLSISYVENIELQYDIKLPEGYRAFITQISNGGAGPAYGMFDLNTSIRCRAIGLSENTVPNDILKVPFRHTHPYNPENDEEVLAVYDQVDKGEMTEDEWEQQYFLYQTAGTLSICHEGCGSLHRLVVSGPTRGQMWFDADSSDQGYFPLKIDFLEWYEHWLDDVLDGGSGLWWYSGGNSI